MANGYALGLKVGIKEYIAGRPQEGSDWKVIAGSRGAPVDDSVELFLDKLPEFESSNEYKKISEAMSELVKDGQKAFGVAQNLGGEAVDTFTKTAQGIQKVRQMFSAVSTGRTEVSKTQDLHLWINASGIKFTLDFTFKFGMRGLFNAEREVVQPAEALATLALPMEATNANKVFAPFPGVAETVLATSNARTSNAFKFKDVEGMDESLSAFGNQSLVGVTESILRKVMQAVSGPAEQAGNLSKAILSTLTENPERRVLSSVMGGYTIVIGKYFHFPSVRIIDVTFSPKSESFDDRGFPTEASVSLSCETQELGNTNMVKGAIYQSGLADPYTSETAIVTPARSAFATVSASDVSGRTTSRGSGFNRGAFLSGIRGGAR